MSSTSNTHTCIHPTAIVDPLAELDEGVEIGPYAVVEAYVRIGAGTTIGASSYIGCWMTIGCNNRIYHHSTVGSDSQAMAYNRGDESYLVVGNDNVIREYTTLNRASDPGGTTRVGNYNCFMAYSHVAHNCRVGNHTIFANSVAIGGHVDIEDFAILGGLVGVHQFCRVGRHSIVGHNSKVNMDVAPYLVIDGHPARPHGINVIGLKRRDFSDDTIQQLRSAYKILFYHGRPLNVALTDLEREYPESEHIRCIIDFIQQSERGILRPRKGIVI